MSKFKLLFTNVIAASGSVAIPSRLQGRGLPRYRSK